MSADQHRAARDLASAMRQIKLDAAKAGLPTERIVDVLSDLLSEERRLLAEQRANERSY